MPTAHPRTSLQGAKRRGNPELRAQTLDCRASLAMTCEERTVLLGISF